MPDVYLVFYQRNIKNGPIFVETLQKFEIFKYRNFKQSDRHQNSGQYLTYLFNGFFKRTSMEEWKNVNMSVDLAKYPLANFCSFKNVWATAVEFMLTHKIAEF